ncbi:alginate lyase family protein [Mucilaginibacter agri]|uniref:Alginate lyase domain-containing protein n=1 Tax=Mucilaginibacter agri TaxID=2695265 RepID=A0A965ZGA5_9SPHI|nr:alginate lyase family protein [Mucilaginibacter agri]NCD69257.1 hypothetical protein [Mucilaginibacter agri]
MKRKNLSYWLGCALLLALSTFFYECKKSDVSHANADAAQPTAARAVTTFVHPGILNTTASLDVIRTQATDQSSSRWTAYNNSVIAYVDSHAVPTSFPSVVVAKSSGTTPTETQIKTDAELAYAIALRWAKTGDSQWSTKAKNILNGWATNFQSYSVDAGSNANQPDLEAAWVAPTFAAAGEILRYYTINGVGAGWSQSDIDNFSAFLNKLKVYINATPAYNNNWNVSAGYAKVALGVFFNSTSVYQSGVDILQGVMPSVINSSGVMPELCGRTDCVHYQYSLAGLTFAAEICREQNDNQLYGYNSSRISTGFNYMQQAYAGSTGCNYCSTSSPIYTGVEVANRYYNTSATNSLINKTHFQYDVPNDNTFLGFTQYTHRNVPL